jgi:polyhydroxyalkanoate synthesis regulator protein
MKMVEIYLEHSIMDLRKERDLIQESIKEFIGENFINGNEPMLSLYDCLPDTYLGVETPSKMDELFQMVELLKSAHKRMVEEINLLKTYDWR